MTLYLKCKELCKQSIIVQNTHMTFFNFLNIRSPYFHKIYYYVFRFTK